MKTAAKILTVIILSILSLSIFKKIKFCNRKKRMAKLT
jgi:hypothetical protein